jgi:hypothetical protein
MDEYDVVVLGAGSAAEAVWQGLGLATLAIRARVPIEIAADTVHPFPTDSEAYGPPLRALLGRPR